MEWRKMSERQQEAQHGIYELQSEMARERWKKPDFGNFHDLDLDKNRQG